MGDLIRLISRNTLRHPLRSGLTALGIALALLAFCFIQTMIEAWYTGVRASARDRIITRNAVSLVFYLPISYLDSIRQIPGIERIGYGNWFGGTYRDEKYRFTQFAIDDAYLDVYPEFQVDPKAREAWRADRRGALMGADVARRYGFKVGDVIQLQGSIFPGQWEFVIHGIFTGREESTVTRQMFFHWAYLNERNRAEIGREPDHVGYFVMQVKDGVDPATISRAIDARFANSFAETLTESETAFQRSFVSMSSNIILGLNVVSIVVIVIMLLVLANTMLMSARERYREYAIMKSLGFDGRRIAVLIFGESLLISGAGFIMLCLLLIPIFGVNPRAILGELMNFFPVFQLQPLTVGLALLAVLATGVLAGIVPTATINRLRVTEGLRRLG